nr:MAG TPA: hypothetical protein [Caudoviricetes sp.]
MAASGPVITAAPHSHHDEKATPQTRQTSQVQKLSLREATRR